MKDEADIVDQDIERKSSLQLVFLMESTDSKFNVLVMCFSL